MLSRVRGPPEWGALVNPAEVADITPNVIALYDTWFDGQIEKLGSDAVLQATRNRLEGILKGQQGSEDPGPGQYLKTGKRRTHTR